MNRNDSRPQITEPVGRLLSPSPEMKPAEVLREHCESHNLQLIHVIGNRVCACPNGCLYRYPSLEKLMEV